MSDHGRFRPGRPGPWGLPAAILTAALMMATAACSTATAPASPQGTPAATTVSGAAATSSATPSPSPVPATPTPVPSVDLQKVRPNELGTVPILEYHVIADAEEDQWTRTPEHFRQDLQKLYDAGYRPIALNDLLDGKIDLPAGTSPVAITFDDSSPGQFRFIKQGEQTVVDPDSAVGMMEAFHASHPDFAARATFNVLPEAAEPHKLFGQPEYESQKLQYLVSHGFEIGNHTYWHQRLDEVDDQGAQKQLALAVKEIQQAVPGYQVRTLALPLGIWPDNRALAFDGSFEGTSYHNDAVLLVGSDPAPSPFSGEFDPHALPRVQVFGNNLDRWLTYLAAHPDEHYLSDGDPDSVSFPQSMASHLSKSAIGKRTARSF
jgi:peptidoglycan/xylan/chitin deacetylase (PgdA/CDA1 family)